MAPRRKISELIILIFNYYEEFSNSYIVWEVVTGAALLPVGTGPAKLAVIPVEDGNIRAARAAPAAIPAELPVRALRATG